ncbi:hypothetical protein SSKA14_4204 [Stenotrophomonas sp. SKA14]|nr:hypothetical protein SSKA14_4204 [Stenotrophomonas sp. SKA14]
MERFINAIASDLEEGGFREVTGTTLRRNLTTAVQAALPLLKEQEGGGHAQPGGRVMLGDQAERARFEAWVKNHVSSLARAADGEYASNFTHALWSAWLAALSAQPSPGGQDGLSERSPVDYAIEHGGYLATAAKQLLEARNVLDGLVLRHEELDDVDDDEMEAAQDGVRDANSSLRIAIHEFEKRRDRALAARQPVEFERAIPTRRRESAVELLLSLGFVWNNQRWEDRRHPVGEPVTVEAVATVRRNGDGDRYIDWLTEGGIADLEVGDVLMVSDRAITDEDGSGEVYAAPPAQAVDLGAVRALLQRRIEQWRSHLPDDPGAPGTREIETKGEHDYNNDVRIYREGIAVMEEVLALTDSQAVGNVQALQLDRYDAGLLSDVGGGDTAWWLDYLRSELARAHDHYQHQVNPAKEAGNG